MPGKGSAPGRSRFPRLRCAAGTVRRPGFLVYRNFPGYELITAILDKRGHLIIRVRVGVPLPLTGGGWLPDGPRLTYLDEPARHRVADRLPLRVAEHSAVLPEAPARRWRRPTLSRRPCSITRKRARRRCSGCQRTAEPADTDLDVLAGDGFDDWCSESVAQPPLGMAMLAGPSLADREPFRVEVGGFPRFLRFRRQEG